MEILYLQVEEVEYLHDLALELYGGRPGRDHGKLEGALGVPYSGYGDYENYPSIIEKAAVYHYFLASGHCFIDGNKRTSYLAAFTFLDWNGYDLVATDDDVYEWTLQLAQKKEERPPFIEAAMWIGNRAHKREE